MPFRVDIKTIFINVVTALVLLVVIEGILSLGLRFPQYIPQFLVRYFSEFYKGHDRSIIQVTDCAQWDPELFYRLNPGVCRFTNREFDVLNNFNSAGLRDDESSLNNPGVVTLGDSFTMGWGISEEETYPHLIEAKTGTRVLNAGVSSFGTARAMILLKKLGLPKINTLVIQYHSNDYEENKIYQEHGYHLPVRTSRQYDSLKKEIGDRVKYYPFKYTIGLSKEFARSMMGMKKDLPDDTIQAKVFLDILLRSDINDAAAKIVVMKIEHFSTNSDGFVNALDFLLTTPPYQGKVNLKTVRLEEQLKKEDYFTLDDHTNAHGHAKVAGALLPVIEQSPILVVQNP